MRFDNIKRLSLNGKKIIELARNGKAIWRGLPSGYTPVDHLVFTGTQYVNTGFIPNQDTRIICEFMWNDGTGIYGARRTVSSNNFSMRVIYNKWQIGYGAGVTSGTIAADNNWHVADHNKNELYIDGELAATREYVEFSAPYPVAIGAIRAGSIYYGNGGHKKVIIFDNDKLVRYMEQCLNPDGEAGYYDFVTKTFMGNSGTGTIGYVTLS